MGVFGELIEACDRLRQLGPVLGAAAQAQAAAQAASRPIFPQHAVVDLDRFAAANARAYTEALRSTEQGARSGESGSVPPAPGSLLAAAKALAEEPPEAPRPRRRSRRGAAEQPKPAAEPETYALAEPTVRTEWREEPGVGLYRVGLPETYGLGQAAQPAAWRHEPGIGWYRGPAEPEKAKPEPTPAEPKPAEVARQQSRLIEALAGLTGWIRRLAGRVAGVPTVGPAKTVAGEVRGLSWGQRWERLAASGRLLSEEQVRRHTLRRRITAEDIVRESERQEEQERQRMRRPAWWRRIAGGLARAQGPQGPSMGPALGRLGTSLAGLGRAVVARQGVGQAAVNLGRALGGVARAAVGSTLGLAALGLAGVKASQGVQRLADSALSAYEGLERYSGQIATMAAEAQYRQRLRDIRFAQATGFSASVLSQELQKLKDEFQPLAILGQEVKNGFLLVLTELARGMTWLVKLCGVVDWIAWFLGNNHDEVTLAPVQDWLDRLNRLGEPRPRGPRNPLPGE